MVPNREAKSMAVRIPYFAGQFLPGAIQHHDPFSGTQPQHVQAMMGFALFQEQG